MDHLLPLSVSHDHLEVPYFSDEVYDNLGFFTYPNRRNWDVGHLRDGNYRHRSSTQAAAFAQAWLFFGALSEVTGLPVRGAGLIRVSESGGRLVVTTERLHFYLTFWEESSHQARNDRQREQLLRRAKLCLDAMISYTIPSFLVPEHPEVAISIEILLVTLVDTFKRIYGRKAWEVRTELAPDGVHRGTLPGSNRRIIEYLKSRMVGQGWCPHRLASFGDFVFSDTLYTLSLLGTRDLLSGHEGCSADACVGNQVDDAIYNETARHVQPGCACDFVNVDVQASSEIIMNGQIPLAFISKDIAGQVQLGLAPYGTGTVYIAISHVWVHGLGNPDENALRSCQLLDLDRLLKRCWQDQDPDNTAIESGPIYFWLDTLCLPLRPQSVRKTAIKQMRHCYESATSVLVLDKHIRRCTAYTTSVTIEPLLQIAISDWRYRVWTLQEAVFANNLLFQFVDVAVNVIELVYAHFAVPSAEEPSHVELLFLFSLAPGIGIDIATQDRSLRVRHPSLATVVWSLQGRAISKPEDEPLCAASLLRQDHILGALLDCPREDRMKVFWRLQGYVPAWVPFLDGPKLQETGYRWAPSALRYKFQAQAMTLTLSEDLGTIHPDGLGLTITKSGFFLLEREGADGLEKAENEAFRIQDDRGLQYDIVRSPDKFNPPLPELGKGIAVIVAEWTRDYYPQVLVCMLTQRLDLDRDAGPIHSRIICRGIVVAQEVVGKGILAEDSVNSYRAIRVAEDQSWLLE
ncbi:hypothetical protein BDW72DRAFT_198926 [Aspergillus terricola var. indicus]